VRARSLLEEDRREAQRRDRLSRSNTLEGELAQRRRDENAQPTIRSQDQSLRHGVSAIESDA